MGLARPLGSKKSLGSSWLSESRREEAVKGAAGAAPAGEAPGRLPQQRLLSREGQTDLPKPQSPGPIVASW